MYGSNSQKKSAQYLLWAYCLFIVYGCFIPFHFNLDPNFVRWRWEVFLLEPIHGRIPRASLSDVVSNILLFVPFGILCIWVRMANGARQRALLPVLLTAGYGLVFGVAIESGQTLSPWRSPSSLDVMCNGTGALIGAISGRVLFRTYERSVKTGFVHVLRQQPSLLALSYLLLGVLVDSFYPFDVTLDLSAIWQNVKQSQFIPFNGGLHRYWFDLFIEKGAIFAAIAYLVSINIRYRREATGTPLTWLLCSALAFTIETGKLFFAGRAFYSENVIIASCGALAGVLLLPRLSVPAWVKQGRQAIWFIFVLGFLVYFQLSPFEWISLNELTVQFSRIEWLPFKAYYSAEPLAALFDLQQKIYFLIPLGFVVRSLGSIQRATVPRRRALLVCIFIAAGLESLQILVRFRIPSTTDVIIFSASAWVGMALFEVFQSTKMEMSRHSLHQRQTNVERSGISL
jgi:glycopeptide antibiotics resistance protein